MTQDDGRVRPSARALAARDAWLAANPSYPRTLTHPLLTLADDDAGDFAPDE